MEQSKYKTYEIDLKELAKVWPYEAIQNKYIWQEYPMAFYINQTLNVQNSPCMQELDKIGYDINKLNEAAKNNIIAELKNDLEKIANLDIDPNKNKLNECKNDQEKIAFYETALKNKISRDGRLILAAWKLCRQEITIDEFHQTKEAFMHDCQESFFKDLDRSGGLRIKTENQHQILQGSSISNSLEDPCNLIKSFGITQKQADYIYKNCNQARLNGSLGVDLAPKTSGMCKPELLTPPSINIDKNGNQIIQFNTALKYHKFTSNSFELMGYSTITVKVDKEGNEIDKKLTQTYKPEYVEFFAEKILTEPLTDDSFKKAITSSSIQNPAETAIEKIQTSTKDLLNIKSIPEFIKETSSQHPEIQIITLKSVLNPMFVKNKELLNELLTTNQASITQTFKDMILDNGKTIAAAMSILEPLALLNTNNQDLKSKRNEILLSLSTDISKDQSIDSQTKTLIDKAINKIAKNDLKALAKNGAVNKDILRNAAAASKKLSKSIEKENDADKVQRRINRLIKAEKTLADKAQILGRKIADNFAITEDAKARRKIVNTVAKASKSL